MQGDGRFTIQFDDVLSDDDGVAIAEKIAQGQLSRAEVTSAAIARAEAVNPTLNAITCPTYDYARRRSEAEPVGALSGVPTFIKDTDALEGFPSRFGSRSTSDAPAAKSSDFVKHFQATGVIPIGLSTTPEFGHAGTAEALLTGPTRNP